MNYLKHILGPVKYKFCLSVNPPGSATSPVDIGDNQGGCSDVVSVSCFGVRVSVMFHIMFVHYTFSSVWVAEWPPFGK